MQIRSPWRIVRSLALIGALAMTSAGILTAGAQTPAAPTPPAKQKAPDTETEIQRVLATGGTRLTGAQVRALQVGNTYYFSARSKKIGAFYTAEDGRYAFAIVNGPIFYGVWRIDGDAFVYSTDPEFKTPSAVYTVKGTEGIYGHFRVKDGLYTDSIMEFKQGNTEKFMLPDIKPPPAAKTP